jgi:hypothetical protein
MDKQKLSRKPTEGAAPKASKLSRRRRKPALTTPQVAELVHLREEVARLTSERDALLAACEHFAEQVSCFHHSNLQTAHAALTATAAPTDDIGAWVRGLT